MKRIKVFEARVSDSERTDKHAGYFVNAADGIRATKGAGWWGGDGAIYPVELVIYDTFEEFKGEEENKLRERALGKLSDEERKALGYE